MGIYISFCFFIYLFIAAAIDPKTLNHFQPSRATVQQVAPSFLNCKKCCRLNNNFNIVNNKFNNSNNNSSNNFNNNNTNNFNFNNNTNNFNNNNNNKTNINNFCLKDGRQQRQLVRTGHRASSQHHPASGKCRTSSKQVQKGKTQTVFIKIYNLNFFQTSSRR
jgi:hypothetical protein